MAGSFTFNTIVISPEPRGRFVDAIIDGTPVPGTVMQIKAATEAVGGKFTYEVYNRGADGDRPQGAYAILLVDELQGLSITDAYVSGDQGRIYFPLHGDELLMLFQDVSGTGDSHAIGDIMIVDDGTGKLIATTGTPEEEPFTSMETVTQPLADTHVHTQFSG